MAKFNSPNKFLWYLLVLLAFFVLVFFTKPQYSSLQENKDIRENNKNEMQEKKQEFSDLDNIKMSLKNSWSWELDEIKKYKINFTEDELIDFVYTSVRNLNTQDDTKIIIRSVSFNPWSTNELWFTEWSINLNVNVSSLTTLKKLLNLINDENGDYNLFISSLSVNYLSSKLNNSEEESFDISLPIKLLYKS